MKRRRTFYEQLSNLCDWSSKLNAMLSYNSRNAIKCGTPKARGNGKLQGTDQGRADNLPALGGSERGFARLEGEKDR